MPSRTSRIMSTLAVSALSVVVVAGPTLAHAAGDDDTHRGQVGRHAFGDSEKRPGALCMYAPPAPTAVVDRASEFIGVVVRPPKMAAIDRKLGIDRARVAWGFVLKEKLGDDHWQRVKRSPLQVTRTSEHHAAHFSRMKLRYDGDPAAQYRVKTRAIWLKRGPRRAGIATHLVDYYRVNGRVIMGSCPGFLPVPAPTPASE